MIFKEGLAFVFRGRRTDGEVTDPFFLYCKLSDLCSSGFLERKKIALFYAVDKRLCVFERLLKGTDGETELLSLYAVVEDLITEGRFRGLVSYAAALVKEEREEKKRKKRRGFFGFFKRKKTRVFL